MRHGRGRLDMALLRKLTRVLLGAPRDPLNPKTREHIALIAVLGWVGLGADGLSSSCYGPEEAYRALGSHQHLALYLVIATALTVFIIAAAYNQVIELFPSGGGGYKVATRLLGAHAGLVSGAALIVDYVLTIAISVAGGVDAIFSLLPLSAQAHRPLAAMVLILLLILLNLRGMKESIRFLLPVFLGFVVTHAVLIGGGILAHADRLPSLIPDTLGETRQLGGQMGWTFVASLLLFAYSQGGGTYTGLEAVSNNVNTLAEPRVKTGKWTMFYIASSLALTAGGILLLYLLWRVAYTPGETLNATVFKAVMENWRLGGVALGPVLLPVVMLFEAGLLLVAANTGFLGGPAVLANMAADQWVPHQFSYLSSRLVTKYGVVLMGLAALVILWLTRGRVAVLVILYSINVFLTFSLSLLGLCVYWWRQRRRRANWLARLLLSWVGFVVAGGILLVLLREKFAAGAWETVVATVAVIAVCLLIRKHYAETEVQLRRIDGLYALKPGKPPTPLPDIDPTRPTAIFMVGKNRGAGMHTLLWVQRLFPDHFKNFVFLRVGEVDSQSYGGDGALDTLRKAVDEGLDYYTAFCHSHGLAAAAYRAFGTDTAAELTRLAEQVRAMFPNCVFFASTLIFVHDNWLTRILHNQTAATLQRRLHLMGAQMVILPMKL